jgi:hypothetical protein
VAPAVGIVAVLGLLVVVYQFILGGLGHSAAADPTSLSERNATGANTIWAFFEGIVAVFALSRILAMATGQTGGFVIGLLVAVVAGIRIALSGRLTALIALFYSVVGLIGSIPAIAELFDGSRCDATAVDRGVVLVVLFVLLTGWAAGAVLGFFAGRIGQVARLFSRDWRSAPAGLAMFGAVDVIVLAAGPVGSASPAVSVKLFWAVAVIGFFAGVAPELVMAAAGAALGVLSIFEVTTSGVAGCDSSVSAAPLSAVVGFCLAFAVGAWLVSKASLRRARRGF